MVLDPVYAKHSYRSPYQNLLQTNYAPSLDEISEIKELIQKPEEDLRTLNEKIAQLQVERDKLQSFVNEHQALLSPARRLPRDVLAEIFLQCLPRDHLPVRSVAEAPLLLTNICRSWREIAITTPRLWRAIHFVFPTLAGFYTLDDSFRSFFRAQKEGLELWLNRSGSVSLVISCYMHVSDPKLRAVRSELETMYIQLLELLSYQSQRWKSFYCKGLPAEVISAMCNIEAPRLNSLFLENNGYSFGNPSMSLEAPNFPFHAVARAPTLRVLHLRYERVDPFTLPIQWDGLTDLTLYPASSPNTHISVVNPTEMLHRLAQTCCALRRLKLGLALPLDSLQDVELGTQTWPHLSELHITLTILDSGATLPSMFKGMFNVIATPVLSRFAFILSVGISNPPQLMAEAPFLDFLARSGCQIKVFELDAPMTDKALMDCLEYMPFLTTLHLNDLYRPYSHGVDVDEDDLGIPEPFPTTFSREFFHALTPTASSSQGALCPQLTVVTLKRCVVNHTDELVAFAQSRCGQHDTAKLSSFTVTFQLDHFLGVVLPPEVLNKAELLKERGINADWRSIYDTRNIQIRQGPPPSTNAVPIIGMPELNVEY
ncbi:hypothetical protein VNI00_003165 [Paramarasmius palmivorus]|uniref:F-box domain-containing protein n=1 Tax=Paramarasmius palmivorus TaxID=297713 RepID=A0AAW0DSE8_9AGAR